MYLVVTRMPGESYSRRLGSPLFCLCNVRSSIANQLACLLILGGVSSQVSTNHSL